MVHVNVVPVVGVSVGVKLTISDSPEESRLLPDAVRAITCPTTVLVQVFPAGIEDGVNEVTVNPMGMAIVAELSLVAPVSRFVIVMLYGWFVLEWNVVGLMVELNRRLL